MVKEDHLILFGELCDPRAHAELTARAEAEIADLGLTGDDAKNHYAELLEGARLGTAPRRFKSVEERLAEALEKEPDADEYRQAELRRTIEASQRHPVGSFDATFSAQKSISLYRAGLLAQGRVEDAAKVEAAHRAGVAAALEYLQKEAGFSRSGHHGKAGPDGASSGRYVEAHNWIAAEFVHETSRAGDVQKHSHLQILNRVPTRDEDGRLVWRTLDSRGLHKARAGMEAVYHRTMEEQLVRDLPVELATREDGKAREIIGITIEDREAASTRRQQVKDELAEDVELYKQRTGHEPNARTLSKMAEKAALKTRDRKEPKGSMEDMVDRWERQAVAEQRRTHAEMADNAEGAAVAARLQRIGQAVPELDREQIIRAALDEVQTERASFGRDDVMRSINRALPEHLGSATEDAGGVAALLESLTDEALTGVHDVIQVAGFEAVPAPDELRRESDGRSVYQPGRNSQRYATVTQLRAEERLVAVASRTDAPRLEPEQIEAAIGASTLGEDQAAAVRGILGDGRQVSVVVGPAGTGKSYALGVTAKAWEQAGGRVIGLAPSNVAAAVLAEEGLSLTTSIQRWTMAHEGLLSPAESARLALRPGDLVIVDEAVMAEHKDMAPLIEAAAQAGAKVATVGDEAQMQSVGAGGSFRMLRQEVGGYELTTVRRFRDEDGQVRQWEADASLQLRDGDPTAMAAYEEHGRLHGGTADEMAEAAVRAYVTTTIDGKQATLTTPTNEDADNLSGRIRAELVRLGRVAEDGVPVMGGNAAGLGDLIQTRENEPTLVDSAGLEVINRRMYRVERLHDDGSMTVRHVNGDQLGGTVLLSADYVGKNVALGYAGTVHATQGRTVHRGYLYGDDHVSREAAYVALSRGTEENVAFLVTERSAAEAEGPELRRTDTTPLGLFAQIIDRETTERSATETLRAGLDHAESLTTLAPIWSDLTEQHTRTQCREALTDILGPDAVARLDAEQADPLYRQIRERQLQGHDPVALLRDAVGDPRSLSDARSLGALLQDRVEKAAARRTPEHEPAGPDWRERTPEMPGPIGEFAAEVATAMQARQEELGRRAAEQAPEWAVERLGPVPEELLERAEWERRAGIVEAYRETYRAAEDGTAIGQAPHRSAAEQRAAWDAAYEALGRPDDQRHIAAASDEQLRAMIGAYEREQAWAPAYPGEQMADAHRAAREAEQRAILAAAEARVAADAGRAAELEAQAAGWQEMAAGYAEQLAAYEEIHGAHALWRADTERVREDAQAAAAELQRRQAGPQPARGDQVEQAPERVDETEREPGVQAQGEVQTERAPVEREHDERSSDEIGSEAPQTERVDELQGHEEHDRDERRDGQDRADGDAAKGMLAGREQASEPEPQHGDDERATAAVRAAQPQSERGTEGKQDQEPDATARRGETRTLQQELRTARAYLERRAQRETDTGREQSAGRVQELAAAEQERAHRESARVMRERAAEQQISRGFER